MTFEQWKNLQGEENPIHPEERIIQTNSGVLVRAKSEKMIADQLQEKEEPFFYEKKLVLDDQTLYPDFTLFSRNKQREIYWEHFGLMDHPIYCNHAVRKLMIYASHQILIGHRLIVTMETKDHPLDMNMVRSWIETMLP